MRGGALHQIVTSLLDLVGLLFLIAAVAVFVATWSVPGALAVAGAGLLVASFLIDHRQGGKA